MIDQRALEAACQEFKEWLYIPGKVEKEERAAINAAIRAYETALWRPIDQQTPYDPNGVVFYRGELYLSRGCAVVRNAMYRTIAPPSPVSTQPAAEEA